MHSTARPVSRLWTKICSQITAQKLSSTKEYSVSFYLQPSGEETPNLIGHLCTIEVSVPKMPKILVLQSNSSLQGQFLSQVREASPIKLPSFPFLPENNLLAQYPRCTT